MSSVSAVCPDLSALEKILASMGEVTPDKLIPLLQFVQHEYGYLPEPVVTAVSERTRIPLSRIYGVATFYEQFHLEPRGRHTIKCCRGTACHVKGGKKIIHAVKSCLGIDEGETTPDMRYTLETVACLGTCFLAPVIMVNNDYYGHMKPNMVKKILEGYE